MTDELLPVGSIVKIRFSKNKYMIMGYYVNDLEKQEKYDYVAVEYPIGLLSLNDVAGFSADYVKQVLHKGFETEESKEFLTKLKEEISKAEENKTVVQAQNIQRLGE